MIGDEQPIPIGALDIGQAFQRRIGLAVTIQRPCAHDDHHQIVEIGIATLFKHRMGRRMVALAHGVNGGNQLRGCAHIALFRQRRGQGNGIVETTVGQQCNQQAALDDLVFWIE